MVSMASANVAPAKFTNDSMASESKPTEPVNHHASILSTMVMTATNTEIRSKLRGVNQPSRAEGACGDAMPFLRSPQS